MKFTPEQIKEKYDSLPEDIKKAVTSVDTTDALIEIGEKYKLHVDKMGELLDETTLVMVGLESTKNFVNEIRNRLEISQDLAENIVKDVNNKILLKVRESLKKIYKEPTEKKNLPLEENKKIEIKEKEDFIIEKKNIIEPKLEIKPEENLNKEEILKEIENPLENEKLIENESKENFKKIQQEPTKDNLSVNVQKKPMVTSDIVENKLTQTTKEPVVEEKIDGDKEEEKPVQATPPTPVVDPYREPIE